MIDEADRDGDGEINEVRRIFFTFLVCFIDFGINVF
jgi:hypothetical protein